MIGPNLIQLHYSEQVLRDIDVLPTKMQDGSEVPKSQLKKLKKDWDRQKKAHGEWLTKFGGST